MPTVDADDASGVDRDASQGSSAPAAEGDAQPMRSQRQIIEALSGLLLVMLVAILSTTIVSNALPVIIHELDGTQSQYAWVVTATLLAMTASTPIWGKLADLFSKKMLVQIAIVIFMAGSVLSGLSESAPELIGYRVLQGIGMGGLQALAQVIIASIIPPRERGRYMGLLGAVMAVGIVGGPLLGGVIVDTSWLGWRWCFFVAVPVAVLAFVVLSLTLRVPVIRRPVKIDYLGAVLIPGGISLVLVWASLGGRQFEWQSTESLLWAGGGALALILGVIVESRVREPLVPLRLFRDPAMVLTTIGSAFVGLAMFGCTVYLSQYFQLARGNTPTEAGLLTLPMVLAMLLATTISGQLISRYGRWKAILVGGGLALPAGLGLAGMVITAHVEYWQIAVAMALIGLGVGTMMQNLVLVAQNTIALSDMGAGSSALAFFRSMGGAIGVSALGAVLTTKVEGDIADGFARLGLPTTGGDSGVVPTLAGLPPAVRTVVEDAYAAGTARIFLIAAPLALVALLAILFLREVPLRRTLDIEKEPAGAHQHVASAAPAAGERRADGDRGPAVYGTVTRSDGGPHAGATLTLIDLAGNQRARASSDELGGYRLEAGEPGAYLVVGANPPYRPVAATVTVTGGAVRHDVSFAGAGSIAGRVHTGRNDPRSGVGGVVVTVIDEAGNVVATTVSGGDGEYLVTGLAAGDYTLTAAGSGAPPVAVGVEVPADGQLRQDVMLPLRGTLVGSVRAPVPGQPLGTVVATLLDETGAVVTSVEVDADGRFVLDDLPPGGYTLTASSYQPVATSVRLTAGEATTAELVFSSPTGNGHRTLRQEELR